MRYLTLPDDFRPESGYTYGGLEALVDVEPYTRHGGDPDVRWCEVIRVALGSASVYPLKVAVPDRGEGQFKFEEVKGWRYFRPTLEALQEVDRARGVLPEMDADSFRSAIPPGIDRPWLWKALREA